MSLIPQLLKWVETKPLVLLRFADGFEEAVRESRHGVDRFTFAKPHDAFHDLKLPTLCIAEMSAEKIRRCYAGVAKSKAAITTFDSRLTILKLQALNLQSLQSLDGMLAGKQFQNQLKERLATGFLASGLSPKLSVAIIDALYADPANKNAIEAAAFNIPKLRRVSRAEWEQLDAIKMAMATFGLLKSDFPYSVDVSQDSDSTLNYLDTYDEAFAYDAHVLEDNVIAKDASVVPGFSLIEKYVTGRAVFQKEDERLVVYTANKGPLEAMLGVDLIYLNETVGNTIMVQYKMLEASVDADMLKADWTFRPDQQMMDEIGRMKLPAVVGAFDDYRLYRNPFFFKFVQRKGDGESHKSFIVSLDHLNQFLASPKGKGPKGGLRVSYEMLGGLYLREADLVGLIRSGYIGTHRVESEALNPIISQVASGNRALVLAWQKRIAGEGV